MKTTLALKHQEIVSAILTEHASEAARGAMENAFYAGALSAARMMYEGMSFDEIMMEWDTWHQKKLKKLGMLSKD